MNIPGYHLDFKKTLHLLQKKQYKTIAVQLPEGLKIYTMKIQQHLKQHTQATLIFIADPCYGACDLIDQKLKTIHVDLILHIGHTSIPNKSKTKIKTLYIPTQSTTDPTKILTKALTHLQGKRIGIITTAQHLHTIQKIKQLLRKHGYIPLTAKGDTRIAKEAQILGCNFTTATTITKNVDSFLFIGSGLFHPIGLSLNTKKPIVAIDPYTNTIHTHDIEQEKNKILRQRHATITRAQNAHTFGILIGLKPGQQRLKQAHYLKNLIESKKKKTILLTLDNYSPDALQGFQDIDCYVSTACPRIAIDDYHLYKKPILTPPELEITLGKRKWDDYIFDQII